ncbi:hypothetical protein LCGC14_2152860 [marine sediment metagenome]|uniref:Uncharacterized protein n=1 Tax=marine sediment metagenome TaxID=412755 RepID=A0A0F9DV68_9ZZZZ
MRHFLAKLIAWIAVKVDGDADCPCHICDIWNQDTSSQKGHSESQVLGF